MKKYIFIIVVMIIIIAIIFPLSKREGVSDYKNATYLIDGKEIKLGDNFAYFGNELRTDLDDDNREDVVFLITNKTGESETLSFYVVAALNTNNGYAGSEAYFLGDKIAPQTINESSNPKHKNVIVVNYAVRSPDESMTDLPSIGKSTYLKLDPKDMMWGIVEPNFEGESR